MEVDKLPLEGPLIGGNAPSDSLIGSFPIPLRKVQYIITAATRQSPLAQYLALRPDEGTLHTGGSELCSRQQAYDHCS